MLLRAALLGILAIPAQAETRLYMFEQPGCVWCAAWDREVASVYPRTPEGRAAPLIRLQLRDPLPEDLAIAPHPHFTPTFVLVVNGQETGRIEGYPGESFFWALLGQMLADAPES